MRILVFSGVIIVFLTAILVCGQEKLSPEDQLKLSESDKLAARFVERFRKTRDFGTVWREFRAKDTKCAIRLTAVLGSFSGSELKEKSFEQRLIEKGLDEATLERLFVATWNASLMWQGYFYSYARSRNGSEPAEVPSATSASRHKAFRKLLISFYKEDAEEKTEPGEPPSQQAIRRIIDNSEKTGKIIRKYAPRDFLKTRNWKSAIEWFSRVHDVGRQVVARERFGDWCDTGNGTLYVSQIGFFVFLFIEEDGQMRLWSMNYVDD